MLVKVKPEKEELEKLYKELGSCKKVGKIFSLGPNTIKRLCEEYNIKLNKSTKDRKIYANIGDVFSKLTILKFNAENDTYTCKCECDNIVDVDRYRLISGNRKTCGCSKNTVKPGEVYGRLTVLEFAYIKNKQRYFLCLCECNNTTIVQNARLISGITRSCNCARSTGLIETYNAMIYSAREALRHCYSNLPFEFAFATSQRNCYLCDSEPKRTYNKFLQSCQPESAKAKVETGIFIFNGLDRVDSSIKEHTISNCLPCCTECNRYKLEFTFSEFINHILKAYEHIKNINVENFNEINIIDKFTELSKSKYKLKTIKHIKNCRYNEMNLELFVNLSQMSCFYCGSAPMKSRNFYTFKSSSELATPEALKQGTFIYNGIDRINSDLSHVIGNIVPCCYLCNSGKGTQSPIQFKKLICDIYNNITIKNYHIIEHNYLISNLIQENISEVKNLLITKYSELFPNFNIEEKIKI